MRTNSISNKLKPHLVFDVTFKYSRNYDLISELQIYDIFTASYQIRMSILVGACLKIELGELFVQVEKRAFCWISLFIMPFSLKDLTEIRKDSGNAQYVVFENCLPTRLRFRLDYYWKIDYSS